MTWTDEPPKVPGAYWFRWDATSTPMKLFVVKRPSINGHSFYVEYADRCFMHIGLYQGQWQGPIEPEEKSDK